MDYDPGLWASLRDDARRQLVAAPPFPVRGSDVRPDAIDFARQNARNAGIAPLIQFEIQDFPAVREQPSQPPGLIICNPPYGERLGDEENLIPLYQQLGDSFAEHWPFWRLAVFTANDRLAKQIRLPVTRKTEFFNGSLACKLWEFQHPDG
jgi:putative N6-adenine-specific DNA methylase